jgi:hypothetical protein
MAKAISVTPKDKHDYFEDSDRIPDVPEAIDSTSSEEELSLKLVSKYQVKAKEPRVALNLNEPAPFEECSIFRVKIRTNKEKYQGVSENNNTIKEGEGTDRTMECSPARKDSKF